MEQALKADVAGDVPVPAHARAEPFLFERAFEENFRLIHRFLARRVGRDLADELAADTFAIAYRRWASFESSRGPVRPWLFGIATVLLRRHWQRERQLLEFAARSEGAQDGAGATVEEMAFARELASALAEGLARLSDGHREVLLLHAWGELSGEEIATALGLRTATVRTRLSRARAQLREYLAGLDPVQLDLAQRLPNKGSERAMEE